MNLPGNSNVDEHQKPLSSAPGIGTDTGNVTPTALTSNQARIILNLIDEAKKLKSQGNSYFTTQNYEAAEVAYSRGLKVILGLSSFMRKHYDEKHNHTSFSMCSNSSATCTALSYVSMMAIISSSSMNNSNGDHHYHRHRENDIVLSIMEIVSLQVAFWSNQAFVLNNLGKFQEAQQICTDALHEIGKERKGFTSLMEEIKKKESEKEMEKVENMYIASKHQHEHVSSYNSIHNSSENNISNYITICEHILDALALGQIKIKYRRAKANESLHELQKAEQDLQENLVHLKQSETKTKNRKKNISDTIIALGKVREKLELQRNKQHHDQNYDAFEDAVMKDHSCNDDHNMINDSRHKRSQIIVEQLTDTMDVNASSVILEQPKLSSSNITIEKTIQTLQKEGMNNKCTSSDKLYPTPDKQKEIVMKLLRQSPRQGEAFFLINFDWWKIWIRHCDFFMDNEYAKLLSNYLDSEDGSSTRQKIESEIIHLEKERNAILSLLPTGAIIPEVIIETRKNKLSRTSSDDISVNRYSYSFSDEDNSDDDDDDNDEERNIYGPEPSVINNSNLLFQYPHGTKNLSHYDGSSVFYFQWNHRVKYEGIFLGNRYVLRPRLVRGHHFELIPREVYAALRCWYGESTPAIYRRATNFEGTIKVILYPELQWNQSFSTSNTGVHHDSNPVIHFCGACGANNARLQCSNCSSICYCNASCQASHWAYHKGQCKIVARRQFQPNYDPFQFKIFDPIKDFKYGRVGLNNLGNTCFMNSALQCLSHSAPLTRHFLSNRYKDDLNDSNPLGAGGKLANAYNVMIKEIWMSRDKSSISPTALKRAIAMFAPRFSGVNQHDSQEFLAFLLDGLHEDLNRIKNPPYIEKADVSNDHNLSIAGEEAWDAHCLRNRSVVMDTFYGAFKSTCVCPLCDNVSVSFDAFNHVSLEIPQRKNDTTRTIPVLLFSVSSSSSGPIRYAISLPFNANMGDVKFQLSKFSNIPTNRLFLCDVFESKIYEIFQDDKGLMSIDKDDVVVAYEIDPYSKSKIHMISYHWLVRTESQKQCFGYPLLSSFGTDLTCREVWQHFRSRFSYLLPKSNDNCNYDSFQIRLVDSDGNPRPIFGKRSPGEQSIHESTPLLPQSDDKFANYVGQECVESFLFVSIEWDPCRQNQTPLRFDDRIFNNFSNHVSVIETIRKQRSSNNANVSLEDCFEQFVQPERLDEDNKWYCSACKNHVRAEKTMEIWRLPNVLIIHLKRFEFKHSLRREKLEILVDFPIEGLDMSGYSSNEGLFNKEKQFVFNGVPAWYDLFGVVNHYGRMGFGHYTSFARRWKMDSIDNDWALFDDSTVKEISNDQVVSSAAYVLFYRRRVFV